MSDFVRFGPGPGIRAAGHESAGMRRLVVGLLAVALTAPLGAAAATPARRAATASDHLAKLVALSRAPEYRRFGTPAMGKVADYAGQLARDGYQVVRYDAGGLTRWAVDYGKGHSPQ